MALSIAYAGSKGTHLPEPSEQLDQLPPVYMALGSRLQDQVPNPFFGLLQLGTLAARNVARGQLPPNRNSTYHSAQINLEKQFEKGGTIVGAYSRSKLISDTDTLTGWSNEAEEPAASRIITTCVQSGRLRFMTRRIAPSSAICVSGDGNPQFGVISGQYNDPRLVQFAMRLMF